MGRYRVVETDRQERSYEARIWWALWGIALLALIYTVYHQFREYDLIHNGQSMDYRLYSVCTSFGGRFLSAVQDLP